jgi:hypothetical protein
MGVRLDDVSAKHAQVAGPRASRCDGGTGPAAYGRRRWSGACPIPQYEIFRDFGKFRLEDSRVRAVTIDSSAQPQPSDE